MTDYITIAATPRAIEPGDVVYFRTPDYYGNRKSCYTMHQKSDQYFAFLASNNRTVKRIPWDRVEIIEVRRY